MPQAPRALRVLRLLTATGIGFMPVAAMAASGEGGTVQNGFRLLDWLVLAVYVVILLAFAIGLLTIAGSTVIGLVPDNLLEVTNKTVALLMCPMFGLFFLAIFVPFATPFGAVLGALCSFASAFIVAYWDLLSGRPGMSFQWIAPTSFAVSMGASCLLSLLPTRPLSTPARLTLGTAVLAVFVTGFWFLARAFTHA